MMTFDEYRKHDATGLAELVADKQVSAAELLTLAQERAAAMNPKVNAIVRDVQAELSDDLEGPFAGVGRYKIRVAGRKQLCAFNDPKLFTLAMAVGDPGKCSGRTKLDSSSPAPPPGGRSKTM